MYISNPLLGCAHFMLCMHMNNSCLWCSQLTYTKDYLLGVSIHFTEACGYVHSSWLDMDKR